MVLAPRMTTEIRDVQDSNALPSIAVTLPMVTAFSEEQRLNALKPIDVTLLGMATDSSAEHPSKTW
jgi:hypothetical protein